MFNFLADNMDERPKSKSYFHVHSQGYRRCVEAIESQGYRAVMLARHPVNRAISAYFNKFCVYRGERLLSRADLEPFAQELHDLYCDRNGAPREANTMSFEAYLDTVNHLHGTRKTPTSPLNGHWDTQVPPFYKELKLRYDTIVHVENLDAEMADLAEHLGLRYQKRAMNRTAVAKTPGNHYLGACPAPEVSALPFGYDNFITPQTIAKIRAIYAVDFKVLRYPPDPRSDHNSRGVAGLARRLAPMLAAFRER